MFIFRQPILHDDDNDNLYRSNGSNGLVFISEKEGLPTLRLYQSSIKTIATERRRRLDALSTCHIVICDAYSNYAPDVARRMLEKKTMRFGTASEIPINIDEFRAVEKSDTSAAPDQARQRALECTTTARDTFESRLIYDQRIRKQHFTAIRAGLALSFKWFLESRLLFVRYMEERGWIIRFVEAEADVAIARDATPQDVIISSDSYMLGYTTIHTLWRPVSGGVIFEHSLTVLLPTLDSVACS